MQPIVLQPVGLHGLAAPYGVTSQVAEALPGPRDVRVHYERGCFALCLEGVRAGRAHVDLLIDHDSRRRLATTRNGSLILVDAPDGLMFYTSSLVAKVTAETYPQVSCGFDFSPGDVLRRALSDGSEFMQAMRCRLLEISLTRTPAFRQTWTKPLY